MTADLGRGGVEVRAIAPADEAALVEHLAIRNAVTPDNPDSLAQVRWETATYPGQVARFLALDGNAVVATATTGRIWMHDASFGRWWLGIWTLPAARGRGIGSRLYVATSGAARAAGKTGFQTELSTEHATGHRFLAARGFVEVDRTRTVRLALAGLEPEAPTPAAGIRLTTLAARPDLLPSVHRVAIETFPDMPTGDAPMVAGTFDEFVARDVDRVGLPRDAFVIAVDEATGEAAGYANLAFLPGSTTIAWHDMTGVRPAYRGRGLALALKLATIRWAVDHGLEALETGNDEHNAAMRAVNARLGYTPMPDSVGLQGPLAPAG